MSTEKKRAMALVVKAKQLENMLTLGVPVYPLDANHLSSPVQGSHEVTSGFDQSVRDYFNAPAGAKVEAEFHGREDYQIGDYTWDSDPAYVEVSVTWWEERETHLTSMSKSERFDDLPSLWESLT